MIDDLTPEQYEIIRKECGDVDNAHYTSHLLDEEHQYKIIFEKAVEVIGNREVADRWLKTPLLYFHWKTPSDILKEEEGYETIYNFLVAIDYGVYM